MLRYFLVIIVLVTGLAGCATTRDEITLNTYKALETSAITYDAVMSAARDMHVRGQLSDTDWNRLKDNALLYYDAYQTAVETFVTHMKAEGTAVPAGESEQECLAAAVDVMMVALRALVETAVTLGVEVKEARNE